MARFTAATVIAIALTLAIMARMPTEATAITCGAVNLNMLPCMNYIRNGGDVPSDCCNGLNNIVNAAKTTDDRRTACNCLKSLASGASNDELIRAAVIPDKCGIPLPYKFSPSTDCAK
ncbi:non-specific lipid-transfer protein 1-like [Phalaenopsis equestris]|uniref:non-specific lipid-transfer protein 1-like n=1 Tax=Phalaenopsis equestris TaxID=78828 RepID=UPI0009E6387C|nr:non-specific lipid-transfer protein 1-like [Phalaenopsis equestris]